MSFWVDLGFSSLLMIFASAIFVLVLFLLFWTRGVGFKSSRATKPRKWLFYLSCCVFLAFLLFSVYFGIVGQRPFEWFVFSALLGIMCLYFGGSRSAGQRRFAVFGIMLLVIIGSLMPLFENRGLIFGPDQWRDLRVTSSIISQGSFSNNPEAASGFYGFIPLFNVLNASLSEVLGCPPMLTFAVLLVIISLVAAFSVYGVMLKLTGELPIALAAVLMFISVPRLALTQSLPSTISISLGLLVILLFLIGNSKEEYTRSVVLIIALLAFVIAVVHPLGIIPILSICLGLVLLNYLLRSQRLGARSLSFARTVFGVCFLIPIVYWSIDSQVFLGVLNPLLRFTQIFTSYEPSQPTQPSIYTPQYESGGFELSAFAWALPVAISAAYITVFLVRLLKKPSSRQKLDISQHIFIVSGVIGLIMIVAAFVNLSISPGASFERYVSIPAYGLLILPASFVVGRLLSLRRSAVVIMILILSIGIVAGFSSPDWAPFENPEFGAVRHTSVSAVEAYDLGPYMRNFTHVYEDNDMPLAAIAGFGGVALSTDRSYQTVRDSIQRFIGKSSENDFEGTVFILKNERIADRNLFGSNVNVLFDSGRHLAIFPFR